MTAQAYTRKELSKLHLPGFGKRKAKLAQILADDSDVQAVLSLTLLRKSSRGRLQILTSVRRGDNGRNRNHQDVISTHTIRLPIQLARQLAGEAKLLNTSWKMPIVNPGVPSLIAKAPRVLQSIPQNREILPFAVSNLLSTKLDCGDILELSSPTSSALCVSQANWVGGYSYVGDRHVPGAEDEAECMPLIMIGIVGFELKDLHIAPTTSAYWGNTWVDLNNFEKGVREKDPRQLIIQVPDNELVSLCVRGLCIDTSIINIKDRATLNQYIPLSLPLLS